MELTLVDASNPIHEWMERARSTVQPELDEKSLETDALIPSLMVTVIADPQDLQRHTGSQSVSQWARKNIDDNHKEKRKTYAMRPKRQSTRLKGRSIRSDVTTEDENSPTYQESNDNNSRTSSDDGNDGDDTGGGTASLTAQGGGHERPLSPFTSDEFTHCTQDEDHDVLTSPRISVSEANAPMDSSTSSSQWTDDLPIPVPYIYHISDIHSQQPTRWIYEWGDPELYNMCYQNWQSTVKWINFI
jgi:hypothetical protein